jgi:hypothetical protein
MMCALKQDASWSFAEPGRSLFIPAAVFGGRVELATPRHFFPVRCSEKKSRHFATLRRQLKKPFGLYLAAARLISLFANLVSF